MRPTRTYGEPFMRSPRRPLRDGRMFAIAAQIICPTSPHDQHRTGSEMHDAVGAAANHAIVERGVAARADDEQVGLEIAREIDDVENGMPDKDVGLERDRRLLARGAD